MFEITSVLGFDSNHPPASHHRLDCPFPLPEYHIVCWSGKAWIFHPLPQLSFPFNVITETKKISMNSTASLLAWLHSYFHLPKPTENFRAMFQSMNLLLQENAAKRFSETHELSQKRRTPQSDVPTCTYISLAWHEELTVVLKNWVPRCRIHMPWFSCQRKVHCRTGSNPLGYSPPLFTHTPMKKYPVLLKHKRGKQTNKTLFRNMGLRCKEQKKNPHP